LKEIIVETTKPSNDSKPIDISNLSAKVASKLRLMLDRENQFEAFATLGMIDPFDGKRSILAAQKCVNEFEIGRNIYPDAVTKHMYRETEEGDLKQEWDCKTIITPSREMIRAMIRAVLKWGSEDSESQFLMRFGLVENIKQF